MIRASQRSHAKRLSPVGNALVASVAIAGLGGALLGVSVLRHPSGPTAIGTATARVSILLAAVVVIASAAWRARDEAFWMYSAVTVAATCLATLTAATGLVAGTATLWIAWAFTADPSFRDAVLGWIAVLQLPWRKREVSR